LLWNRLRLLFTHLLADFLFCRLDQGGITRNIQHKLIKDEIAQRHDQHESDGMVEFVTGFRGDGF